jgi:hypothetical protein
MTVTRFVAVKMKDEYAGDDEKSKQTREEFFQKHMALYKSRPYVTKVQGERSASLYSTYKNGPSVLHGRHAWWPSAPRPRLYREHTLSLVIDVNTDRAVVQYGIVVEFEVCVIQ